MSGGCLGPAGRPPARPHVHQHRSERPDSGHKLAAARRHRRLPPAANRPHNALPYLCCSGVDPAGDDAADEGGEEAEGQEGVEGVDWRYGSVDELDEREWQVGVRLGGTLAGAASPASLCSAAAQGM